MVRFLGDDGSRPGAFRRLERTHVESFDGGLIAWGSVTEGVDVRIDEGAHCTDQALTRLAFAALPDGRTCLGLQYVVAAPDRVGYTATLKSIHLNMPNDLFNGYRRRVYCARGEQMLTSPPQQDEILDMDSRWINVDGKLGLVALFDGASSRSPSLCIDRATQRRGGRYHSLYTDEICLQVETGPIRRAPGQTLIDAGFAVLSGADVAQTAAFKGGPLDIARPMVRGVWAVGADGRRYVLLVNWGDTPADVKVWEQTLTIAADRALCQAL
jgi:hypothetical protein